MNKSGWAVMTLCASAVACSLVVANAGAQTYPNRTIRLVSPYAPGGGTDLVARVIAQKLTEALGQSVVVDNRPGAGGVLGADSVVRSAPDGYTILFASPSPMVVAPHLMKTMPYDPFKDLIPITLISVVPAIMAVHPSLPVKTVKDFIALAKSKPGQLSYSSSGNGGTGHLAGALFDAKTGTHMVHVPYKGTAPATTALISGEVSVTFGDIVAIVPFVKTGRVRAIAVAALKRNALFPDLPTIAETIPGYTAGPWYGLLVPAKTPPEIVARLNKEAVGVLRAADTKASLASMGAEPIGSTPAEFTALMRDETERWGKLIRDANIKADL